MGSINYDTRGCHNLRQAREGGCHNLRQAREGGCHNLHQARVCRSRATFILLGQKPTRTTLSFWI